MKRFALALGAAIVAISLPARTNAQTPESAPVNTSSEGRVTEWVYGERIPAVRGLPFSAKVELETVSQLQDGTLITHKTYNLDARDSAGRTRNEMRNWITAGGEEPKLTRIQLYDPATKTRTDLFPLTKLARQWVVAAAAQATPVAATAKPETTREEIGTDTIESLPVKGTRVTQTYATGALGNDRPLTIVTEYWYAAELRLNLLTKRTDPRHGVQTIRVTELQRQEPDAALFAIGDDYKVLNEAGPTQVAQGPGATDEGASTEKAAASAAGASGGALAGIARPGVAGVTVPACVFCPDPSFTDAARAAKFNGSVVLQVVVTADGHAENISVVRKAGYGLEQSAIETVRKWQFRPAKGPDGNPVATVVPIEVTFRIK
ncbi:MAG TPA: energy transducer TonB [Candidatus Acidoferrum sp.]|nr:energy transducer TonB [Candidatus Acidoferrum sp.]